MNYLDKKHRRNLIINTSSKVYEIDFLKKTLSIDNKERKFFFTDSEVYESQHENILKGKNAIACSFEEGLDILRMVYLIENKTSNRRAWIVNEKNL